MKTSGFVELLFWLSTVFLKRDSLLLKMKKDSIRIVLIGDSNCGKSTLIECFRNETFINEVSAVSRDVEISGENTLSNTTLTVHDTPSYSDDKVAVHDMMRLADILVLILSADDYSTQDRYFSFWSVLFNQITPKTPIIVVVNKTDLLLESERESLRSFFSRTLSYCSNVEVCVECSAKSLYNTNKILYYAEKAIVYPVSPLMNRATSMLTADADAALRRVFRLFNKSRTCILTDKELNDFQIDCFGCNLSVDEITSIKSMISDDNVISISNDGITEDGFVLLMKRFIRRGSAETVWSVLWRYGYDDDVKEEWREREREGIKRGELTMEVQQFIYELFRAYDSDHDGYLSLDQIKLILASLPPSRRDVLLGLTHPLLSSSSLHCEIDSKGRIDAAAWLTQWQLLLRIQPSETVEALIGLGWSDDEEKIVKVMREKDDDWLEYGILHRSVIHLFIIGGKGVGKSSLVRRLIHSSVSSIYLPTKSFSTAVATIERGRGERGILCVTEVPEEMIEEMMSKYKSLCDLYCCVYDVTRPHTLMVMEEMMKKLPDQSKVMMVAMKSDRLMGTDEDTEKAEKAKEIADRYGLETPLLTNRSAQDRLFPVLFDCAVFPEVCVMQIKPKSLLKTVKSITQIIMVVGVVVCGVMFWRKHL